MTQRVKLRQTSGEIRLCKLFVTEVRGSPAVHVVVLVSTRILKPIFAPGKLWTTMTRQISILSALGN
jgi:hypothetical protein